MSAAMSLTMLSIAPAEPRPPRRERRERRERRADIPARTTSQPSASTGAARPAPATAPASAIADSVADATLVARVVASDDRAAFAELARRHQSPVRNLLRRLTRNDTALADDLAQETFILVYRNLRQFRGDARFSTWIYRIAYNAFLAHARAQHPTQELPEHLADDVDQRLAVSGASALRIDLERALDQLSPGEREAIIQCYYQDLSHEEAATVLGCPLGTVKTNILRGKQKLKAMLAAWSPEASSSMNDRTLDRDRT